MVNIFFVFTSFLIINSKKYTVHQLKNVVRFRFEIPWVVPDIKPFKCIARQVACCRYKIVAVVIVNLLATN